MTLTTSSHFPPPPSKDELTTPSPPSPPQLNPWEEEDNEEDNSKLFRSEESEFISEGEIKRPSYRSPFKNFLLIATGTVSIAMLLKFMFFPMLGAEEIAPPKPQKTGESTLDNTDQQRAAEANAKLAIGGADKAFSTHNTQKPTTPNDSQAETKTSTSKPTTSKPTTSPSSTSTPAAEQKRVERSPAVTPQPSIRQPVASSIPMGGGSSRRSRQQQRLPLVDESSLFAKRQPPIVQQPIVQQPIVQQPIVQQPIVQQQPVTPPRAVEAPPPQMAGPTLVAGGSASAYLLAPFQFPSGGRSQAEMRVAIRGQLLATSGYALPQGSQIAFSVNCDPSNNVITAISGDAFSEGRRIRMEPGAITLTRAGGQPLIAELYRPGEGRLAVADRNNSVLSGLASVGENLSGTDSTVVTTGGSTVVSQKTNQSPWAAFAKGAFGQWSKTQTERTEAEAKKLQNAAPIQILSQQTGMVVTVTSPTVISYQ